MVAGWLLKSNVSLVQFWKYSFHLVKSKHQRGCLPSRGTRQEWVSRPFPASGRDPIPGRVAVYEQMYLSHLYSHDGFSSLPYWLTRIPMNIPFTQASKAITGLCLQKNLPWGPARWLRSLADRLHPLSLRLTWKARCSACLCEPSFSKARWKAEAAESPRKFVGQLILEQETCKCPTQGRRREWWESSPPTCTQTLWCTNTYIDTHRHTCNNNK